MVHARERMAKLLPQSQSAGGEDQTNTSAAAVVQELLDGLLSFNPRDRITMRRAMQSPLFDTFRVKNALCAATADSPANVIGNAATENAKVGSRCVVCVIGAASAADVNVAATSSMGGEGGGLFDTLPDL